MVMVEHIHCAHEPPCRFYNDRCIGEDHAVRHVLEPVHWALREGVATAHLTRISGNLTKDRKRADQVRGRVAVNHTGRVEVMVADTDTFRPLFDDAAQSAFRVGGMDAVRALQKSRLPPKAQAPRKPRAPKVPTP